MVYLESELNNTAMNNQSASDSVLSLEQLKAVSRGMVEREQKYLEQFLQLCDERSSTLKQARASEDTELIKRTVHSLRPQMLFFGVSNTKSEMEELQLNADNLSWDEIDVLLNQVLGQMKKASIEVKAILKTL
jgi:HPt (histidine-containing phosphotransfer) domain-containing protein